MNRSIKTRLAKLMRDRQLASHIPVLCEDEADFEAVLAEMIEAGEISENAAPRCRPWWEVQTPFSSLTHEAWVDILNRDGMEIWP